MSDGSVTDDQAHQWLADIADAAYLSLHFDNPGLGGADQAEISGGGYLRYKMAFSQPANRTIWSLDDARFNGLMQTKLSFFGIWNAAHKGMLRAYGSLPEPVVILNGKGYLLNAGSVAISIG